MSIKIKTVTKVSVRLAVAALAVAGVWAASGEHVGAVVDGDPFLGTTTMSVLYEVKRDGKLEVTANNPANILDVDPTKTVASGTQNGNLGLLKVTTTSTGWDVVMTTEYGGLLKGGKKTGIANSVWDMGCMCSKPTGDTTWVADGEQVALKYTNISDKTDQIDAQLKVAIGMLDNVNKTTKVLKGLASQQVAGNAYAIPLVNATDLKGSTGDDTPISFVKVLQKTPSADKLTVGGVTVEKAMDLGFGPTATGYTGPNAITTDGSEWFFVNVGLPSSYTSGSETYKLIGNAAAKYTETFTFKLIADF